jgi:hypothetical protein
MPATLLDHCLATHPVVRIDGPILLTNPFYEVPALAVARTAKSDDVDRKLRQFQPS